MFKHFTSGHSFSLFLIFSSVLTSTFAISIFAILNFLIDLWNCNLIVVYCVLCLRLFAIFMY